MIWDEHAYLMVDVRLVEDDETTSMVRESAFKYGDGPIVSIEDDQLSVGGLASSYGQLHIVRESGIYRMWYEVRGVREALNAQTELKDGLSKSVMESYCKGAHIAYAESDNGIDFHPVTLNQVSIKGSTANNLISFPSGGAEAVRVFSIFRDPLDAEYPYKCVYYRPGKGEDFSPGILARYPKHGQRDWWYVWGIGKSKDGLQWEAPTNEDDLVRTNPEHAHLHRALDGGMIISDQMMSTVSDWGYRGVKGWVSYDLQTAHRIPDYLFHVPEHIARGHNCYMGTTFDGAPWTQPHLGLVCARKGPTVIALNGYLHYCAAETFAQTADVGLCISDTGVAFREVWAQRPFIPLGHRGQWDSGMVGQASIVDTDDESRLYYCGGKGNLAKRYEPGLAYVPRDRYGYRLIRGYRDIEPRSRSAHFTIKDVVLPGSPELALNVDQVDEHCSVRVAILDDDAQPLPGYALDDSEATTTSGLRVPLRWREGRTGSELSGQCVKVQIELHSANCGRVEYDSPRVYAFYAA